MPLCACSRDRLITIHPPDPVSGFVSNREALPFPSPLSQHSLPIRSVYLRNTVAITARPPASFLVDVVGVVVIAHALCCCTNPVTVSSICLSLRPIMERRRKKRAPLAIILQHPEPLKLSLFFFSFFFFPLLSFGHLNPDRLTGLPAYLLTTGSSPGQTRNARRPWAASRRPRAA